MALLDWIKKEYEKQRPNVGRFINAAATPYKTMAAPTRYVFDSKFRNQANQQLSKPYENIIKPFATGVSQAGVAVGDVALRSSTVEPFRQTLNLIPRAGDNKQNYLTNIMNRQRETTARPLMYEKIYNKNVVDPKMSYWDNITKNPDTREFIGRAVEAPTYLYGGVKGFGSATGNIGSRILNRSTAVLPEAGIQSLIDTYREGNINNLPRNIAQNAVGMALLSNASGLYGDFVRKGGQVGLSIKSEPPKGKVDVGKKLYHVSDNPNLKIDPNYSNKQGQMGKAFYATENPKAWQSGQIGKRPYVYEIDTSNLKIAKETPSRSELIKWGSENGYYKKDFLKKPDGSYVLGTDGKKMKVWQETPKAEKLMTYKDPMTGSRMSGLEQEYLKAKGYDGVEAVYSPDGSQVAIFNYDKIKTKPLSQPTVAKTTNIKAQQPDLKQRGQTVSLSQSPKSISTSGKNLVTSSKDIIPQDVNGLNRNFDVDGYIKLQKSAQDAARKGSPILENLKKLKTEGKSKLVDFTAAIEDTLNKAEKRGKLQILPSRDIRYQVDKVLRSDSVASQFIKDRGLSKVIQDVDDLDMFNQYLIAKQARDVSLKGIKTGRNLVDDKAFISTVADKYEPFAQQVYKYSHDLLDYSEEAGLISKSLVKELRNKYPNYVPLNRIFNEIEQEAMGVTGRTKSVASLGSQGVVKKLKGSTREIENPLESIISKTATAFEQGEKNKAAQMLYSYKDLPGNPFGIKSIDSKTPGQSTVSVFLNGEKQIFETLPEIADAAKNLSKENLGLIGKIVATPTRVLKLGATGLNLPFVASNIVKDQMFGTINSSKALKTSIANPINFGRSFMAAIKGGDLYDDWVRSGSSFTSFDIARNQLKPTVARIRGSKNAGSKIKYTVTHPQEFLRALEDVIGKSEELTRIQQFSGTRDALLKEGRTTVDADILAANASRFNTANFARRGSWGTPLNATIPYLNAGIQGTRSLMRSLKTRPVQTGAKLSILLFAPTAMATTWNLSDPLRKSAYEDIADFEKENNIIIMPPNPQQDEQGRWNAIKIPLTPGLSNLASIVRRQIEGVAGMDGNKFSQIATDLFTTGTSIDVGSTNKLVSQFTPQIIKPVIENFTNTNLFTGRDIVPEYMKDLPPEEQVKDYTSGSARLIGKGLNMSPLKVENSVRTIGGGVGQQLIHASDLLLNKAGVIPEEQIGGRGVGEQISNRFTSATGGQKLSNFFNDKQTSSANEKIIKGNDKYYVKIGDNKRSFDSQSEAELAVTKDEFKNSDKNFLDLGASVLRKSASGNVSETPKTVYNDSLYYAQLNQYKKAGDMDNWMKTAELKANNLQELINDPNTDALDRITYENRLATLISDVQKYQEYGGFKKPKKGRSGGSKKSTKISVKTTSPKSASIKQPKKIVSLPMKGGTSGNAKRQSRKGNKNRELYA